MVKNLPGSLGGMDSIPGPGRFPRAREQLSPCTTARETTGIKRVAPTAATRESLAKRQRPSTVKKLIYKQRKMLFGIPYEIDTSVS